MNYLARVLSSSTSTSTFFARCISLIFLLLSLVASVQPAAAVPPDDDDGLIIPVIIKALAPVCASITVSPATVAASGPLQLSVSCTKAPVSYEWLLNGNPLAGSPTTTGVLNTTAPATAGTYTYSVRARNGNIPSALTSTNVNVVANQLPSVTITLPANGSTLAKGNTVTIAANASDSDGSIAKVEFYVGAVKVGESFSSPYSVAWSNASEGSYNLTARATDNRGALNTSAPVAITVVVPALTATLNTSGSPYVAPAQTTLAVSINGASLAIGETITQVRYYQNGSLIGTLSNPSGSTFTKLITGLAAATYNFTADITTSGNRSYTTPAQTITVSVAPPTTTTQTLTINWDYDANGHVSALTYPDNSKVSYALNALGEATQIASGGSGAPGSPSYYANAISYHPTGAIAGFTYGNNIVHSQTLNTRNLPSQRSDVGAMNDIYTYDPNGNIVAITDNLQAISSRSMGYDGLDRLTVANGPSLWGNGTYTYDPLDNLRVSTLGNVTTTRGYNASTNQLNSLVSSTLGTTNIYYDVQGNVSQRGSQAFVFDEANRLTSATNKASYRYDGLGRRTVINAVDGSASVQFYSSAGQILYSTIVGGSSGAGSATRYVYLGQRLIAETKLVGGAATNSTRYIHTDGLGSPVAHTDSAGTVVDRSRYEAYGANVNIAGSTNPVGLGFTGHVNDVDTGLVYMQQRYYDPVAGRFLSTDQVLTDTSSGASFNRYVYTSNNPYRYTDPDGRDDFGDRINAAEAARCRAGPGNCTVYNAKEGGESGTRSGVGTLSTGAIVGGLAGGLAAGACDWFSVGVCLPANPYIVGGSVAVGAGVGALGAETFSRASEILAKNIEALTNTAKESGEHTHHIVARGDSRAAFSRAILAGVGMDINSGFNGINMQASYHQGIHTNLYHATVFAALIDATTYSGVATRLTMIKAQIKLGIFPY